MNKVKLGFFSFTEITDPRQHRAYNEWHMLDHMPEQFPIEGIAWGERFVSTPACTRARLVADPMLAPAHYMTCYFLTEPVDRTLKDFVDWGGQLRGLGRFFQHRKAHLGGPFLLLKGYAASRVLISPEAVPYRPKRGVIVHVWDLVDAAAEERVAGWQDRVHIPDLLGLPGVAGIWSFMSRAEIPGIFANANPPGRRISLIYLDEDPLGVTEALGRKREEWRRAGRLPHLGREMREVFLGPLEAIAPWRWDWFDAAG